MAGASASKAAEKNRVAAAAGRMAHLRSTKYELEGFKPGEPMTISKARSMAGRNARQNANLKPISSMSGR